MEDEEAAAFENWSWLITNAADEAFRERACIQVSIACVYDADRPSQLTNVGGFCSLAAFKRWIFLSLAFLAFASASERLCLPTEHEF